MKRLVCALFCLLILVGVVGCDLRRQIKPSVLVIAVEGLNFDSIGCDNDGTDLEEFLTFCTEAVRFSHAYSPSTMSQAALASLMTGLYPFDHGVHHNGSDFLSARHRTLAESAIEHGYRTFLVSGGAPIWKKSGLAQGFEVFDDSMDIGLGQYYRPADEVIKLTINWMEQQGDGAPSLAVAFLNDLQFPQVSTLNREGQARERSSMAQLEEIGESLVTMIQYLKKRKRWNSTHVVLVGLNSLQNREFSVGPSPLNLKSSGVQVALFIKPARKERDNVIQWTVDRSVSLVDLGSTLFHWMGDQSEPTSITALAPTNLSSVLSQPEPRWKTNRLIVSESAWPDWLEGAGVRWSVRQGNFLYIDDEKPLIYNTLTDRMELLPLKSTDPFWSSLNSGVIEVLNGAKVAKWRGMSRHWVDQIQVARELWQDNVSLRRVRGDEPWSRWYLRRALIEKNWREVKRLSLEVGDSIGAYVASINMGENRAVPRNSCLRLMVKKGISANALQSECEDELILALYNWVNAPTDEDRNLRQDRFVRLYTTEVLDDEIGRLNYLNELRWDVNRERPMGPSTLSYILSLKNFEPYARRVSATLGGKDLTF